MTFIKFILSYRYTFDFDRYSVVQTLFCIYYLKTEEKKKKKILLNLHLIKWKLLWEIMRLIPFSRPRCSYPKCRGTVFHTFRFNLTTRSDSQDEVNDRQGGST